MLMICAARRVSIHAVHHALPASPSSRPKLSVMSETDLPSPSDLKVENEQPRPVEEQPRRAVLLKWGVVFASALVVLLAPVPAGITPQSWRLLAIFVATIVGSIVRPVA